MRNLTNLMRDVDLLFSNVESMSTNYFFRPVQDCSLNYPVFDQRYNDTEQQIIIAATGATKDDFCINLKDDILSIKRINSDTPNTKSDTKYFGNKFDDALKEFKVKDDEKEYTYARRNISRKKFDIAFKIPKIWDSENLTVKLENGELIITIPIKPEEKPKVIDFKIQ